jgi:hypothetical protein
MDFWTFVFDKRIADAFAVMTAHPSHLSLPNSSASFLQPVDLIAPPMRNDYMENTRDSFSISPDMAEPSLTQKTTS